MAPAGSLTPGALFAGAFRIVRPLSAGGMGAVYVAEQLSTGKLRALKLMHPALVQDARLRERFDQEARVGARIPSDHVVEVVAAGVAEASVPWIAMELLEGEDLAAYARRRGPLPPGEVLQLLWQLCHALGAAHVSGIVHRDVKPENVFLARTRAAGGGMSVKVLDFGIAKVAAEAAGTSAATGSVGTPLWMAPEQAETHASITPAADVWSLGLLAFYLLTGRVFWLAANAAAPSMPALLREVLIDPLPAASERAAAYGVAGLLPPGFDAWFRQATARDPRHRFPSAQELFTAATAWGAAPAPAMPARAAAPPPGAAAASPAVLTAGAAIPAGAVASTGATGAAARRPRGRGSWIALGALALALMGALVAVVALLVLRPAPEREVRGVASPPSARPIARPEPAGPTSSLEVAGSAAFEGRGAAPGSAPRRGGAAAPPPLPGPAPSTAVEAQPAPAASAPAEGRPEFDPSAAAAALQAKVPAARKGCADKEGAASITVTATFRSNGRVSVIRGVPYSDRASCVTAIVGTAKVEPFAGSRSKQASVTVAF